MANFLIITLFSLLLVLPVHLMEIEKYELLQNNIKHKCVMKSNCESCYTIAPDGLLLSIIQLLKLWKWDNVVILISAPEITKHGWDLKIVFQLMSLHFKTTMLYVHQTEHSANVIHALEHLSEIHSNFIFLGIKETDFKFMDVLKRENIVKDRHIWIFGMKKPTINKNLNFIMPTSTSAQFIYVQPNYYRQGTNKNVQQCQDIFLYDVFFAENMHDVKIIPFGKWTHKKGLFIMDDLRGKQRIHRLQRKLLRGLTFQYEPYSFIRRNGTVIQFYGYITDIVRIISRYLNLNFQINISDATSAGTLVNNTYTGIVGSMYRREADIAVNVLSITRPRYDGVSFSYTVIYGVMGLWLQSRGKYISTFAHILAFSKELWMATIVTTLTLAFFLIVSTLYYSNFNSSPKCKTRNRHFCYSVINNQFINSIMFFEPKRTSSKIFLGTLLMFFLFLSTYYNSIFMSVLTYTKSSIPFSNAEELLQLSSFKMTLIKQANYHDFFNQSKSGILQQMWKRMVDDNEPLAPSMIQGMESLCKFSNVVFLADYSAPSYLSKQLQCHVSVIKTEYLKEFGHISTRKDFPYNKMIYKTLIRMKEYGLLSRLKQKYFNVDHLKRPSSSSEILILEMRHFYVPFYVCTFGLIFSIFVLIVEICVDHFTKKI